MVGSTLQIKKKLLVGHAKWVRTLLLISMDEYNRALDKAEKINRAARPVFASCALIVLGAMEIECHTVAA
jgi:hypothetical protein